MKQTITKILSSLSLIATTVTYAQTNSVELLDGTGTLISSHASIGAAYATIPATLTQAYTIELTNAYNGASETYPITFISKTGASAANSITLRPAASVTSATIQSSASGQPIINLNDADYITIDGRAGGVGNGVLIIRNNATTSSSNTIQLINGACFNMFRNLDLFNSTTTGTGRAVFISTSASNPTGNSDNVFTYCNLTGGRYMFNNSGTAANPNSRTTIFGCNFKNASFAGYWGQANSGKVKIDSCSFFCTAPISETLYFGVLFDAQSDSAIILNNRFYDLQIANTGTVRYIHVRSSSATGSNTADIRNNFFSMMTGNASSSNISAIEISNGANLFRARVAHNTVRFGGALTTGGTAGNVGSSGLIISTTNSLSAYEIKNNIFVNERNGGTTGLQHLAMAITSTVNPSVSISDNTYNSVSGNLIRLASTVYTTIATYQAAVSGGEPSANDVPVQFISNTDLHLTCVAVATGSLNAVQLSSTLKDIDGNTRSAITHRGADELLNVITAAISSPTNVTCNGLSNGAANVNATNGTLPYTYSWTPAGGNTANATGLFAGNYTVSVSDAAGCVVTKTATITEPAAINANTSVSGNTITAITSGATYQWINCTTSSAISGENSQSYIVTTPGNYQVNVTVGSCSVTSSCVPIISVGIQKQDAPLYINIYPNPSAGLFYIDVPTTAEVFISNVIGEIIFKQTLSKDNHVLDLQKYPVGIYSVNIITDGNTFFNKLIKQ